MDKFENYLLINSCSFIFFVGSQTFCNYFWPNLSIKFFSQKIYISQALSCISWYIYGKTTYKLFKYYNVYPKFKQFFFEEVASYKSYFSRILTKVLFLNTNNNQINNHNNIDVNTDANIDDVDTDNNIINNIINNNLKNGYQMDDNNDGVYFGYFFRDLKNGDGYFYDKLKDTTFFQTWSYGILNNSEEYRKGNWIEIYNNIEIKNKDDLSLEELEKINCVISYDIIFDPVTLSCGHTYSKFSIIMNMRENNSCPICRKKILNYEKCKEIQKILDKCHFIYRDKENEISINLRDIEEYWKFLYSSTSTVLICY
jgi:hypothetical protein